MTRQHRPGTVGRGALLWVVTLWLAVGVGGWFAPPVVEAASVKSLQSGVATSIPLAGTTVTLSPQIDATKAFVVCSVRTTTANSNDRATCVLTDTTLTIDVGSNASTTNAVSWYVVEFEGGVTVQRATATFNANATTPSAAPSLSAVDCTKSFVVLAGEQTAAVDAATDDEQFTFRAILATTSGGTTPCTSGSSSNLTLTRTTTTASAATVAWQVVTYEGASVQRGTVTIVNTATSNTATLGTPVDTSKSFIVMSRQGQSAIGGRDNLYQARARFTTTGASVTGLTFTKGATSTTASRGVEISWEVVSLSDGSTVQTGTTTSSGTTATMSTGSLTIDTTTSVPFFAASGDTSGTSTARLDDTSWTVALTSTAITFTRGVSSANGGDADWFTVSFNKCGTVSNATNVTANAQDGQATVYWDSALALIARNDTVDFAAGDVLTNGKTYTAPPSTAEAFGTSSPQPTVQSNPSSAASSLNQSGLTNGTTYYYSVFKKTDSPGPCYAAGGLTARTSVTPPNGTTLKYNWSYATGASTFALPGLTPGGVVVAGSNDNKVHGMSASNGTPSFTAPFSTGNAVQSRPAVIPSSLSRTGVTVAYVTSMDGKVYAVDTSDGSKYSSWPASPSQLGTNLQGGAAVWLQAIKNLGFPGKGFGTTPDMVVVGTRNGGGGNQVHGLHGGGGTGGIVTTGNAIWTYSPGTMGDVISTPFIDYNNSDNPDGAIWVTSLSSGGGASLWKIKPGDGTLFASGSLSLGDISSSPTLSLDGSYIYVVPDGGQLTAINATGTPGVVATASGGGSGVAQGYPLSLSFNTPSPSTPDTIIYSRGGIVYKYTFNGTTFTAAAGWTSPTVSGATAPIDSPDGTKVYVGGSDGQVHELSLSSGTDGAQRDTPGAAQNLGDPGYDVDLNRIYIGGADGHLYSFSTSPF